MNNIKVLVVPVDLTEDPRIEEVAPNDLKGMQTLVGGYLEPISAGWWTAYCDEEGKNKDLPLNRRATYLAYSLGWTSRDVLVGPVVFCGPPSGGWDTSVPEDIVTLMELS